MNFKQQYNSIKEIATTIYYNPELGYKEIKTKQTVLDYLKQVNPDINLEEFSTTGIKTTLGDQKKEIHIAFIAELDAVYTPTHMYADKETGAAHNCGHYSQVAVALSLYNHLYKSQSYKDLDYNISFIFVPAEEYLDLDYREELVNKEKISHYGGKPEAMKLGVFDNIDLGICVHAIGGEFDKRTININCDLAGFLYKKYNFKGKGTHAGFDPFSSRNAYNMSTLFNTAIGLSRQQLKDTEHIRINPIVMESDMSTNVIPSHITIGTDIRTKSTEYLKEASIKLDDAANGSAHALQGEVDVHTQMGYVPFIQDRYLSSFVEEAFNENDEIDTIMGESFISAAGDIGDLSIMIPCIQIGYSGFTGTIHGDDFIDTDPKFMFEIFPRFLSQVLDKMNGRIESEKLYKKTYVDYLRLIHSIVD